MTRVRLRKAYPDHADFYAQRYPDGYQHTQWPDHVERVKATLDFLQPHLDQSPVQSLADLSCGDGAIVRGIIRHQSTTPSSSIRRAVLGDLNLDYRLATDTQDNPLQWPNAIQFFTGPVEETLDRLGPQVDLLICSETLEHLDDPDTFLAAARSRSRYLLVTTPDGENDSDLNPEHYWGWNTSDLAEMFHHAGWTAVDHRIFRPVNPSPYTFQMWLVR